MEGLSIGASHYYGKLKFFDETAWLNIGKIELTKEITAEEANKLNQGDKHSTYKVGDKSERFDNRIELIDLCIKVARETFGDNIVVRLNIGASAQPERTAYAPNNEILFELHGIEQQWFDLWENGAEWDTHEEELSPIDEKWHKLNKNLDIRYS